MNLAYNISIMIYSIGAMTLEQYTLYIYSFIIVYRKYMFRRRDILFDSNH